MHCLRDDLRLQFFVPFPRDLLVGPRCRTLVQLHTHGKMLFGFFCYDERYGRGDDELTLCKDDVAANYVNYDKLT